jgi:Uma2 family endonuclease
MMSTSTVTMTAEELLMLPRGQFRYELINGELKTMSPASHQHGRIAMRIAVPLVQFVWKHKLGDAYAAETGFQLTSNPDTVLAPDAAFVTETRAREFRDNKGYWPGAPDLAVEVFSPSESGPKVRSKVAQWIGSGLGRSGLSIRSMKQKRSTGRRLSRSGLSCIKHWKSMIYCRVLE